MSFVHLHCHSPYSFLDGAASVRALVRRAAELEMPALALTDHDNVCGAVEFALEAARAGVKPIQGAEVTVAPLAGGAGRGDAARGEGFHLTLLAEDERGYANLCRLLTRAHLDHPRGRPLVTWDVLQEHAAGLIALSGCRRGEVPARLLRGDRRGARAAAERLLAAFGRENLYLEMQNDLLPGTRALLAALQELADALGVGTVATNNVHYAVREEFPVHDLLTCVRTLTRLEDVHPERRLNAENHLKGPREMALLFRAHPRAAANTLEIAGRCRPVLDLSRRRYPAFPLPPGAGGDAAAYLRHLVYEGAARRYGRVTGAVRARLEHELEVIARLGFADYFLLVWDVVRFASREGIRCAGRGSAADSAVAYCLGITDVDALGRGLLFERFLSLERAEQPDIDVDFDARHRDRVAAYVRERYGGERVAGVCTYSTFRARSALRDLGKAMGLPEEEVDRLARRMPWINADEIEPALDRFPELRAYCEEVERAAPGGGSVRERYRLLFQACARVAGFPRHMGTHLGGLVIAGDPLTDVTPLQRSAKGAVVCQFDKRWVEELGLLKLDLLSLRALSALEDAAAAAIPPADPETFAMIRRGETIGVFQLESPAQRALQARLGAEGMEDIVASLALIRPGPIKGNMVEPFVARRQGREPVTYLHPALEPILAKTYGVVLYQEQVIDIARTVAGFTPGEADRLRRVMSHARSHAEMAEIGREFVARAVQNGVEAAAAERIFACIAGYASYGFCEAHAAAFAVTAYRTAYLARHHPAEYFAALLTHQPMGYYPPATLCVEARRRGVAILGPDVNRSGRGFTVEAAPGAPGPGVLPGPGALAGSASGPAGKAIRVGLRRVKGLSERSLTAILVARAAGGPFRSLADLLARVDLAVDEAEGLILCGACDGLHPAGGAPNRRALLWQLRDLLGRAGEPGRQGLLLEGSAGTGAEEGAPPGGAPGWGQIPDFTVAEKIRWEYEFLGLAVSGHPMELCRSRLRRLGYVDSRGLREMRAGEGVRVAGLPVRPHRPPTRSGRTVVFLSLEDEFGLTEVTVFEDVYRRCGHLLFGGEALPLAVAGCVERRGEGVSVTARDISPLGRALRR